MQTLTDPTLRPYTTDQMIALLTGPGLTVDAGLELLDGNDTVTQDISADLYPEGSSVSRDNYANVHGACHLLLSRQLAWGAVRVRPYMTLYGDVGGTSLSPRFNLGVYVLTTPPQPLAETPATFEVDGQDKLYLLQFAVGDTYTVTAGTGYLDAVKTAISAAGAGTKVILDPTAAAKTLPADMAWPLSDTQQTSWLGVVNDLLAAVGYRGLWVDWDGYYRSEPYQDPSVRGIEFTFNADDRFQSIIGEDRTLTRDVWAAPNWWRFIARNWPTQPVDGNGQYTVTNSSDGPTSIDALGWTRRAPVQWLDAVDQAALQAQGDAIVAADKRVSATFDVPIDPFPPSWHFDVYTLIDSAAGGTFKVQGRSWQLNLDGSMGKQTWEVVG